jgi:hypothetical protein
MIRLCTYEDRKHCFIGVKLLVLSLARYCPNAELAFWCPELSDVQAAWLARQPNVQVRVEPALGVSGWDIKPTLLRRTIDEGGKEAIWIDSDIVVTGDILPMLSELDPDIFLATEEMRHAPEPQGSRMRTTALGLELGRELGVTVNSCVLRATGRHVALLEDWTARLSSHEYREAQRRPFHWRPIHLRSDQDVLTGLLGSREYAVTRLRLLRSGSDIASCMDNIGYPTLDRVKNLFRGLPIFVHAQGRKPWEDPQPLSAELSPYSHVARSYWHLVDEPMAWTVPRSRVARVLDRMSLGDPNLRGLPFAMIREAQWLLWGRRGYHRGLAKRLGQ